MRVEYLNPFIEAAAEVLQAEAGANVHRGPPAIQRDPYTSRDVTVVLSLLGQVEGTVMYGLDQGTALSLLGEMLGTPLAIMDDLAQSGVGELGNVITGRATIRLAEAGYPCDISTPTVVLGAKTRIAYPGSMRVAVPLETQFGALEIHLALSCRSCDRQAQQVRAESMPIGRA